MSNIFRPFRFPAGLRVAALTSLLSALLTIAPSPAGAVTYTYLKMDLVAAIQNSVLVSHLDTSTPLKLVVTLQLPKMSSLQAYADAVSDPKSSSYRKFLTPDQIGQLYGPSTTSINQITSYLTSMGFKLTGVSKTRTAIFFTCTSGQAERTFMTKINNYHSLNPNESGRSDYYAFATKPQLPSTIASLISYVGGMEDYVMPRHHTTLDPNQMQVLYGTSGFAGNGGYYGQSAHVGISNWDGFDLSNVPLYYSGFGLPTPPGGVLSNVAVKTIDGGSQYVFPFGEGDLDIQMVLGNAPWTHLIIYDGGYTGGLSELYDVLSTELDDNICDVITESYGWYLSAQQAEVAHTFHVEMSAAGITYMAASGDFGTLLEPYSYPDYDPEVLIVGGTATQTDLVGTRTSEEGWEFGGGGWSTVGASFNRLPTWQVGNGVPTSIARRLVPDIAAQAAGANGDGDTGAVYLYYSGFRTAFDGTSCASPITAGSLATMIDWLTQTDQYQSTRFGRIQDLLYSFNGDSSIFYDDTVGDNGPLPNSVEAKANVGWDFVTGWGSLNFQGLGDAVKNPAAPYLPSNVGVFNSEGTNPNGDIANTPYTEDSVSDPTGQLDGALISYLADPARGRPIGMKLNLVINTPVACSAFIYMYNYTTATYDLLQTVAGTGSDDTLSFHVANAQNYEDASGNMQLVVRAVWPARLNPSPFTMTVSQATALVWFQKV